MDQVALLTGQVGCAELACLQETCYRKLKKTHKTRVITAVTELFYCGTKELCQKHAAGAAVSTATTHYRKHVVPASRDHVSAFSMAGRSLGGGVCRPAVCRGLGRSLGGSVAASHEWPGIGRRCAGS